MKLKWIGFAISVLALAAILYFIFRESKLDAVLAAWKQIAAFSFLGAVLITLLIAHPIVVWRPAILLLGDGIQEARFLPMYRIQLVSQFIANGAPLSALADLARAGMLKLRFHITLGRAVRLIFYERVCAALGAVIVGLLAAPILILTGTPPVLAYGQLALWIGSLAATGILFASGRIRVASKIRIIERVTSGLINLETQLRRPRTAALLVVISLAQLTSLSAVYLLLAHGMNLDVPWWYLLLFMPLIFFVSSLPIFYQGWGGREAIVILVLSPLARVAPAEALALSISFGAVTLVASLPGAVLWLMRPSMRKSLETEVLSPSP